jgi:transposase
MLTVEDYGRIRRAHRDGLSIRAIARRLHHSRRKVREALASPEPRPYRRTKDPPAPVLGPFKVVIDAILAADEQAPRKHRPATLGLLGLQPPSELRQARYGELLT